jgi:hypothetical protein
MFKLDGRWNATLVGKAVRAQAHYAVPVIPATFSEASLGHVLDTSNI